MKKKKKEQLLVDKKECSKCGNILEKDIKVCDECGYDMTMEESFMIYAKKYVKIIKEQVNPTPAQQSPIVYNQEKKQFMSTVNLGGGTNFLNNPALKGKEITIADEGKKTKKKKEKYKYNPWGVCTASVGRDDKKKFEKCVMDVKHKQEMDENLERLSEYIERLITDSEVNPKIKKGNFKQFVSKLK